MKKKIKLEDIKVKSFVTQGKIVGGITTSNAFCATLPCTEYTLINPHC